MARTTGSQASTSASDSSPSTAASPARWAIAQRRGCAPFPAAANSGQYDAIGASRSSAPRSTSRCTAAAVTPLVAEKTMTGVSASQARPVV